MSRVSIVALLAFSACSRAFQVDDPDGAVTVGAQDAGAVTYPPSTPPMPAEPPAMPDAAPPQPDAAPIAPVVPPDAAAAPLDATAPPDTGPPSCKSDSDCSAADYCPVAVCVPRCQAESKANLVPNAGFDTVAGGRIGSGDIAWATADTAGCTSSGSLKFQGTNVGQGAQWQSDCFDIHENTTYAFGYSINVGPNDAGVEAYAACALVWFADKGGTCDDFGIGSSDRPARPAIGWRQVGIQVKTPLGAGVAHARVQCFVRSSPVYVDRIFVNTTEAAF